jgi:RimJ/RimL family protein N-acetyltransferase
MSLTLRPAVAGDGPHVLSLYERLTPQSRYSRFFMPTPRLTAALRDSLTDFDRSLIWLAFQDGDCVGEARITGSTSQRCAELAVTIADSHQGRGLGKQLTHLVVRDHVGRGGCASFSILPTNHAAARLARRSHIQLHFDGDHLEGQIIPRAS